MFRPDNKCYIYSIVVKRTIEMCVLRRGGIATSCRSYVHECFFCMYCMYVIYNAKKSKTKWEKDEIKCGVSASIFWYRCLSTQVALITFHWYAVCVCVCVRNRHTECDDKLIFNTFKIVYNKPTLVALKSAVRAFQLISARMYVLTSQCWSWSFSFLVFFFLFYFVLFFSIFSSIVCCVFCPSIVICFSREFHLNDEHAYSMFLCYAM